MTMKNCTIGVCKRHGETQFFWLERKGRLNDGTWSCKECRLETVRRYTHSHMIHIPMKNAKKSSAFLGVYIAERVLSKCFDHITRMPYGNKGYDFVCGKGFKIDVKSSCLLPGKANDHKWVFSIKRNKVADYFLCLAFDNRENLEPLHIWLIPSKIINDHVGINIFNNQKSMHKYKNYERSLDKVINECTIMKTKTGVI